MHDGRHHPDAVAAIERVPSRRELIQNDAEGELVRTEVNLAAQQLLRAHVCERPRQHAGHGERGVLLG